MVLANRIGVAPAVHALDMAAARVDNFIRFDEIDSPARIRRLRTEDMMTQDSARPARPVSVRQRRHPPSVARAGFSRGEP